MQEYGSPHRILSETLDFDFKPWLFDSVPAGFFDSIENRKLYMEWLLKTVGAKSPNDLTLNHYLQNKGRSLVSRYGGSPQRILKSLYENGESKDNGVVDEIETPPKPFEKPSTVQMNFWVPNPPFFSPPFLSFLPLITCSSIKLSQFYILYLILVIYFVF